MALTQVTIDTAESAGCRTLLLVATEAGRPLYEKIGFEVQTWYRILEAPGLGDEAVDRRIRRVEAADLPAMAELSTLATGEDRGHLLRRAARRRSGGGVREQWWSTREIQLQGSGFGEVS